MDLTQGTREEKHARARKMMLWFGIASLIMAFAGWTSAYIVSSSREDWLTDLVLPKAFYISTVILVISSLTYWLAGKTLSRGMRERTTLLLGLTLILGLVFIALQFYGFSALIDKGYYFTGPTSNITMSYIYLIAVVHIAHVVAGIFSLIVVLVQHIRGRYSPENKLGFELGATFWHFLDLLWVYLILFFTFFQ